MTYIICEPCVGTCDTACVEVCPVDCIHGPHDKTGAGAEAKEPGFDPTDKQLYIDPEYPKDSLEIEIQNYHSHFLDIDISYS